MNTNSKILSILFTVTLIASASTAVKANQEVIQSSSQDISQGDVGEQGLLDQLTGFLSLTTSDTRPSPGDTITLDAEVTSNFPASDLSNIRKIVEVYRCDDPDCTDPNPFVESDSQLGNFDSYASSQDRSWSIQYTVPERESTYEAVAYIYDVGSSQIISTTSTQRFEVTQPYSAPDDGYDNPDGSDDQQSDGGDDTNNDQNQDSDDTNNDRLDVDKKFSTTPTFSVNQETNTVTGNVVISNFGSDDMPSTDIVEMQVRPGTSLPLSFSGSQEVCDPSYPDNVHKEYQIDAKDAVNIQLKTGEQLKDGNQYTVYFLTRSGCGGDRVQPEPYSTNAGSFTLEEDDSIPESEPEDPSSQEVDAIGSPRLSFEDGTVSTTVSFKNKGGAMPDSDIVEMQVRPAGETPLSFSSTQQVCDPSHPENVHKEYQLDSGEKASTTLSTSALEKGQEYRVYLLTREGCAGEVEGNNKVEPYYNSVIAGTVDYTDDGGVEPPSGNPLFVVLLAISGLILVGGGVLIYVRQ